MTSLKTRSSDGTSYESICPECRDGFSAKLRDGKWIYHSWSVDAVRADVEKTEDTRREDMAQRYYLWSLNHNHHFRSAA